MDDIKEVTVKACGESKYIKPKRIFYKQNGVEKIWDAMKVYDGVAILLFNITRNVFVFVRQFRPAIYINMVQTEVKDGIETVDTDKYPGTLGLTMELCAGIIDKDKSVPEIAKSEIMEECGYEVPIENIKKITTCRSGVGTSGGLLHLYYAEITDTMKVASGGGVASEGEMIDVVEVTVEEGRKLMFDESVNRVHVFIFALYWFFDQIWTKQP
ncbi:uridine diphosphate glucose pyrophosphatase NUDT14-like isoform X2 [Physella acuta]|uniref:uridine diphosphate glucose pyrophosphatase NUDT14-like isoform X2 n=1 Tax=Physella acuta TaxID=109671 RepID=UPI0027DB2101|nr:uridine diphosphate glucose pyrophosphatase NUDT14-like isoform X2 [Physella acuta]